MKILLVDVDSKIPNIALCKLSAYYKLKKSSVDIIKLGFKGYPSKKVTEIINGFGYDKIYISNIFSVNQNKFHVEGNNNVEIGGVGSMNPNNILPKEIDGMELDYNLYPENDTSYGFITRGCPRKCSFCFVPKTEGALSKYSTIDKIVRHKKVSFMDNNILAYEDHKEIFREIIAKNITCEFNQGLDIRLVDDENIKLLSEIRWLGEYVFAFDDIRYRKIIDKKVKLLKKYIPADWKLKFFIYHNVESMCLEDTLQRVEWCYENKCLPYLMRDKNCWGSNQEYFLKDLTSYCNQPAFFKKLSFEEFLRKRYKNVDRIESSLDIYNGKTTEDKLKSVKMYDIMDEIF